MHLPREQLAAYLDGSLSEPHAHEVEGHLQGCPECEATLNLLSSQSDTMIEALRLGPPDTSAASESDCGNMVELIKGIGRDPSLPTANAAASAEAPNLGSLREYKLLKKLGEGGMGAVYRALHTKLDKVVALKVLSGGRMQGSAALARFEREMKAVGKLRHPNIVGAFDAGEADGTHFLVMELVDGEDLSTLLKRHGQLNVADACELVRQAAVGLQEAHEHGMVHRDIKPSNLMLTVERRKNSVTGIVKILDMGLALLDASQPGDGNLTGSGQLMGTINYMAPEQANDTHTVDIRADIYALGVVLYELLTGKIPLEAHRNAPVVTKLMAMVGEVNRSIRELRPDLPKPLVALVDRMLAKQPADRPATPEDVATVLEPLSAGHRIANLLDPDLVSSTPRVETAASTSRLLAGETVAVPASVTKKGPPRKIIQIALGLAGAAALLLAGTIFFLPAGDGTIRVEINDPAIEVALTTNGAKIKPTDGQGDIVIAPGEHGLTVKRGDLELNTDKFVLKKGEIVTLKIEYLKEKLAVTKTDGKIIGEKRTKEDGPRILSPLVNTAFDLLDPSQIPMDDRFPWQPKELVAVIGEHRGREWHAVERLAFSPDGKTIATFGGGTARLFDASTMRERMVLPGLENWKAFMKVRSFAFSPVGTTVAVSTYEPSLDPALRIWDVTGAEHRELAVIRSPGLDVNCLAYTADGKSLVTCCRKTKTIQIWDLTDQKQTESVAVKEQVRDLALSQDGKTLVTLCENEKTVRIWDLTASPLAESGQLAGVGQPVRSMSLSADGKRLVTLAADRVQIWDISGMKPIERKIFVIPYIRGIALSPDGKTFVCSVHRTMRLFDISGPEPKERMSFPCPYDANPLAFSPDSKFLTCSNESRALWAWDMTEEEPREQYSPTGPMGPLTDGLACVVLGSDGRTLAVSSPSENVVRVWDMTGATPRNQAVLRVPSKSVFGADLSHDGTTLVVSSKEEPVKLWDLTKDPPEVRSQFQPDKGQVQAVNIAPDGKSVVCQSNAGVHLWDVTGDEPKERAYWPNTTRTFAFAPDRKTLAIRQKENNVDTIVLWDVTDTDPKKIAVLACPDNFGHPVALAWSSNGNSLAVVGRNSVIQIWDVSKAEPKLQGAPYIDNDRSDFISIHSLAFAPDGKSLAYTMTAGRLAVCKVTKAEITQIRKWRLPSGGWNAAAFSQDGRHLITANSNGTAYVLRLNPTTKILAAPTMPK